MKLYQPIGARTKRLLVKARTRNERRDQAEIRDGFASPSMCPVDIHVDTILSALDCGIERKDWAIIAEAMAMTQDLESRIHGSIPQKGSH